MRTQTLIARTRLKRWHLYESDWLDVSQIDEIADEIMTDNEEGVEDGEESRPRRTRRALETLVQEARRIAREKHRKELGAALKAIEAIIKSRKTRWAGGEHGLQAHRARAIRSYFQLVVRKNYGGVKASIIAAESHGFAKLHGSRLIRQWGNVWIKTQDLPPSKRECHPKVASLLEVQSSRRKRCCPGKPIYNSQADYGEGDAQSFEAPP